MQTVKCVVVGDGTVGKTCLIISYTSNQFPTDYVPTVFDNYEVTVMTGDEPCTLALFDTSGQPEYDRLRPLAYAHTDVFLLCFCVVNVASYENVREKWVPELVHFNPQTPFILVGTQIDLRKDPDVLREFAKKGKHPISFEAGQRLAKDMKAAMYVECSALTQEGVKNVFDQAIAAAFPDTSKKIKKPKGNCCLL